MDCEHNRRSWYASFMKGFANPPVPWGGFVEVKHWPDTKNLKGAAGKKLFIDPVCDPCQPLEETACRPHTGAPAPRMKKRNEIWMAWAFRISMPWETL